MNVLSQELVETLRNTGSKKWRGNNPSKSEELDSKPKGKSSSEKFVMTPSKENTVDLQQMLTCQGSC